MLEVERAFAPLAWRVLTSIQSVLKGAAPCPLMMSSLVDFGLFSLEHVIGSVAPDPPRAGRFNVIGRCAFSATVP